MSSAGSHAFSLNRDDGVVLRGRIDDPHDQGPIGIFLHGFRSHINGRKGCALADHAHERGRAWLAFDLRGHGGSDGALAALRLSAFCADLDAVLERLAPRPVLLAGSSLGGWLAALAAGRHPGQVRALLLVAPAFNFIQNYFGALPPDELDHWRSRGTRRFEDRYSGDSYLLDYEVIEDAARHDVFAGGMSLSCPIVVVHGDQDEAVPLAQSQRFIDEIAPAGEIVTVAGGDHRLATGVPQLLAATDRLWNAAFGNAHR
ncbi:MAG: alpha/beta hydrolase [Acidiferrobacteraceae bacterium]